MPSRRSADDYLPVVEPVTSERLFRPSDSVVAPLVAFEKDAAFAGLDGPVRTDEFAKSEPPE